MADRYSLIRKEIHHTYIETKTYVCIYVWRGSPEGQTVPNFTKDYHCVVELKMTFIFSLTLYVLFNFLQWVYMVFLTRKNKVIHIWEYIQCAVGIFEMFKKNNFSIYTYIKSSWDTPTTNTMLCVNYVSIKELVRMQESILKVVKLQCTICSASSPLHVGSIKAWNLSLRFVFVLMMLLPCWKFWTTEAHRASCWSQTAWVRSGSGRALALWSWLGRVILLGLIFKSGVIRIPTSPD